jgi:Protein of unknown function (DUF1592)/Protein of unknown function (DUF1588)/Protein of unknown function (DUF1595)/Protein of unknown function (DUF1587)/Protein of unknown function (DUF1585)
MLNFRLCKGLMATAALLSCTGNLGGLSTMGGPGGGGPTMQGDPKVPTFPGATKPCDAVNAPGSRMFRLTRSQYGNTVKSLLGTSADVSAEFLSDSSLTGYSTDVSELRASDRDVRDYQRAAETLAAELVATPALMAKIVPCDLSTGADCVKRFIREFGVKAYRRPLETDEVEVFWGLYQKAPMLFATGTDAQKNGVTVVVEAMLQSPDFLYRLELGADDNPAATALKGWEVASRLSYMFLGSMPDAELRNAAAMGELDGIDGIKAQAQRLLGSAEGVQQALSFHQQWLRVDRYAGFKRDATKFPLYSAAVNASLKEETTRFVSEVVVNRKLGIGELLSADYAFVNDVTAPIYGVSTPAQGTWTKTQLPDTRRGMLSQLGFLATNAYFDKTDIIHRGVFLHQKVLCTPLPAPSADAAGKPEPAYSETIRTRREQVAAHTNTGSCNGCHQAINPAGFAFEPFNAIGEVQTQDRGHAIDASGTLTIDGVDTPFANHLALTQTLSQSQQVNTCYATQWFRFGVGRPEGDGDQCQIAQVAALGSGAALSFQELAGRLVQSNAFLTRARSE